MYKTLGSPLGALSRPRTLASSFPALPLQACPTATPSLPAASYLLSSLLLGYLRTQKPMQDTSHHSKDFPQQDHPTSKGLFNTSHFWGPGTTSYTANSEMCPKFPTIWAHFWETLSIIFREAQFSSLNWATAHNHLPTKVKRFSS